MTRTARLTIVILPSRTELANMRDSKESDFLTASGGAVMDMVKPLGYPAMLPGITKLG
ncbi:MAG TPA: hypothetical protein PLF81_28930 [Candidatus Anammoximicrobium sp.]|nr:hypothetical protein [Candidatus Anammoximicrobium sp.]